MYVSGINIEAARDFQKRKRQRRQSALDTKYQKAQDDFRKIVDLIIEKHKPKRIYQWGSLLNKHRFSEISDIDIAVEGLPNAQSFFNLLSDAENLTDMPLDIIEMESIHEFHREMILKRGVLIYERD